MSNLVLNEEPMECDFKMNEVREIIGANSIQISNLVIEIKALADLQRNITRYLLIVVCIIALGDKALAAAKSMWGHDNMIAPALAEVKK